MKNRLAARSHYILGVIAFTLIFSSCAFPATELSTPAPAGSVTTSFPSTDWLQISFTDPTALRAHDYEGGPDEALAASIDQARLTVDVAAYSLNLWSIRDALIHAYQRGVVVRMVMESDNMDVEEVQQILDARIPIIGDQHEGLMHDKFVVVDRSVVWTGSMNYTVGGAYKDNNNLLSIRSNQVADYYTQEFEEMFTHRLFGPDRISNIPNSKKLDINGTSIEIYFSPEDKPGARIVELIKGAQKSINFMAYSFTSNEIGAAIVERAKSGVAVLGVFDGSQVTSGQGTEYDPLKQAGLDVRLDGNQTGLMHHKVIIIDKSIVITGSYNFTASAEENNDENVLIIFNSDVAAKYLEEFQRVHDQSEQP